jgi:hypothetical protein
MHIEYHRGEPCVYKPLLCQEGYCSNCEIYMNQQNDHNKQYYKLTYPIMVTSEPETKILSGIK